MRGEGSLLMSTEPSSPTSYYIQGTLVSSENGDLHFFVKNGVSATLGPARRESDTHTAMENTLLANRSGAIAFISHIDMSLLSSNGRWDAAGGCTGCWGVCRVWGVWGAWELICIFTSRADIKNVSGARIPLVQTSGGQLRADGLNVKIGCGVRGRFS